METRHERRSLLAPAAVFLYFLGLFAFVHTRPGGQVERDGYFHARMAQTIPTRGLSRSFPWTQASVWKDSFHDKEFLYHLWLAPFSRGENPIRGAAAASGVLAAGIFALFFLFLKENGVPWPLLGTAVLASIGGPFLLRMSFVRAHVFAVLLFVAALHFLVRNRKKELAAVAFALAWSYSFPLALPAFAALYCLGRSLTGEDARWPLAGAALGGVLAGLLIHPYTPLTLGTLWTHLQILWIAIGRRGLAAVEVAREFAPYGTRDFILAYPGLLLCALALCVGGWLSRAKASAETAGLLFAAAASWVLTLAVSRAIEYAAPLTAAAAMFAARDAFDEETVSRMLAWFKEKNRLPTLVKPGLFLIALGLHAYSLSYVLEMSEGNDPPRFAEAAKWMADNLEEGETVANLWWDDFPELYYSAPRQTYLVGLDPTFMLRWDKDKALKLELMRTGRAPLDPDWLAETFQARILALRAPTAGFYPQLQPSVWKPVYLDKTAALYALRGPEGPSPLARGGMPRIPALDR